MNPLFFTDEEPAFQFEGEDSLHPEFMRIEDQPGKAWLSETNHSCIVVQYDDVDPDSILVWREISE